MPKKPPADRLCAELYVLFKDLPKMARAGRLCAEFDIICLNIYPKRPQTGRLRPKELGSEINIYDIGTKITFVKLNDNSSTPNGPF